MALFQRKKVTTQYEENTIYTPVNGTVLTLAETKDGVFSEGMLGNGFAIDPDNGTFLSPISGKVVMIANTKHAIGLETTSGIQVMIHIGLDTVNLQGKGFKVLVKDGAQVHLGDKLVQADLSVIKEAGYPTLTFVTVLNTTDFKEVTLQKTGQNQALTQVVTVQK